MRKSEYTAQLCPEVHYHVYNRTNNRETLFTCDRERYLFLEKYKEYLSPYVDTFAWCLMENHFHFSIRVKPRQVVFDAIKQTPEPLRTVAQINFLQHPENEKAFHTVIERQFSRMFTSYAMIFNLTHQRSGNLFYRPFKRIELTDEDHQVWLVYYIHSNISKHGIKPDFNAYAWSSYKTFLNDKTTSLCKQQVLDWFGGKTRFLEFHGHGYRELPDKFEYLEIE
ncbi:MAG: transposase [Saprospiraceae bacterium]|nr:transposase [Saprospiraceae bacterium]